MWTKKKRVRKNKDLDDDQKKWIDSFLNWSDVTYMNPGRKDNLYVSKINDERKYKQKRYLLWTIRHLILSMVLDGKIKILKSSVMFLRSICLSPSYVITWKAVKRTFLIEIFLMALVCAKYMKMPCWWWKVLVKL